MGVARRRGVLLGVVQALDLCYYEKGPGLAYLIAASTRLFGISEGAVRLPMAVLSAAAAWAVGRLVLAATGGNARAALLGVVCFLLLPAFQANVQICTQDGVIIALCGRAGGAGLRLVRHWHEDGPRASDWLNLAVLLGVGFLFKQSIVLFVASVAFYGVIQRRRLTWSPRLMWQLPLAAAAFAAVISPMIVWNVRHDWPTLSHTLGHLGTAGGDRNTAGEQGFDIRWSLSLIGAQLGAFGPAAILLMSLATAWCTALHRTDPQHWPARLWMLCCAAGDRILPGASPPQAGTWQLAFPLFRHAGRVGGGDGGVGARARRDRRTLLRTSWRTMVVYGLIGWAVISFPTALARLPIPAVQGRGVPCQRPARAGHAPAGGPRPGGSSSGFSADHRDSVLHEGRPVRLLPARPSGRLQRRDVRGQATHHVRLLVRHRTWPHGHCSVGMRCSTGAGPAPGTRCCGSMTSSRSAPAGSRSAATTRACEPPRRLRRWRGRTRRERCRSRQRPRDAPRPQADASNAVNRDPGIQRSGGHARASVSG